MTTTGADLARLRAFIDEAGDAGRTRTDIAVGLFHRNRNMLELDTLLSELTTTGQYEETTQRAAIGRPTLRYRRSTIPERTEMTEETTTAARRYEVVHAGISRIVDGSPTFHRHGAIVDLTETEAARLLKLGAVAPVDPDTPRPVPEPEPGLPEWLGSLDDLPTWEPTDDEKELGTEDQASITWLYDERAARIDRTPAVLTKLGKELETVATSTVYARGAGAINWEIRHHKAQLPLDIAAAKDIAAQIVARVRTGDIGLGAGGSTWETNPKPSTILIRAAQRRDHEGDTAA